MPKAKSKPKTKRKKVVTPAFKRQIEQARRDLAEGKGITVGELLTKLLERDARKLPREIGLFQPAAAQFLLRIPVT